MRNNMSKYPWPKTKEGHYEDPNRSHLITPVPRKEYPKRYYARLFDEEGQKIYGRGRVKGWIDAWALSSMDNEPPASELIPMTVEQWEYKNSTDDRYVSIHLTAVYRDGEFWDYNPLEDDEINKDK